MGEQSAMFHRNLREKNKTLKMLKLYESWPVDYL